MKERRKRPHRAFGFVMMLVITAITGAVVMLLWNWLMPAIFGLKAISYLQAVGLLVLCKLLFGGFGSMMAARMAAGPHRPHHPHHRHETSDSQRREMIRRLMEEETSDDNKSPKE